MLFELTDEHMRTGKLTAEDYSSVAGQRVDVLEFDEFPYAEELKSKERIKNSKMLEERADAIARRLREMNVPLVESIINKNGHSILAEYSTSGVFNFRDYIGLQGVDPFNHFNEILYYGDFESAHDPDSSIWTVEQRPDGTTHSYVRPGLLRENIPIEKHYAHKNIIVIRRGTEKDEARQWARRIYLSADLQCNTPNEGLFGLIEELHEARHLRQIFTVTHPHFKDAARYYLELDADMAARSGLQRKGIGAKTADAFFRARYVNMMFASPGYWFADALETLEHGNEPQDYFKTNCAVTELKVRIAHAFQGGNIDHISSERLQASIAPICYVPGAREDEAISHLAVANKLIFFTQKTRSLIGGDTAPLYTHLRQIKERGVITDPFADKLAGKILAAAYSFRPELLVADQERPSFRGMDKKYGGCSFG